MGAQALTERARHGDPRQNLGRKARVLAVVHGWMPYLAAGSERMMQHLLDALPREEFDVRVLSFGFEDPVGQDYEYEGLPVHIGYSVEEPPDVIITHHGPAARVVQDLVTDFPDARVVTVFHNERYDIPDILRLNADLQVYNTAWVGKKLNTKAPGLVVHPPLDPNRHRVWRTGDKVTLCNLQDNKGVHVWNELARRMPHVEFLGVIGSHGKQIPADLPNITIHPLTQDMREIWSQTKILLMPSGYESYGMVAAEACVSGIPVIANPTDGLVECLDDAGIFVPRDDVDGYERVIRLLLEDPEQYRVHSELSEIRGWELTEQTTRELKTFVKEMRGLV